jgi:GTP cyclohydrolase II
MQKNPLKKQAEATLPTDWGTFTMMAYARRSDDMLPHLVMVHENKPDANQPVWLRIHSECMTGDVFHSLRCDCGEQLDYAMNKAAEMGGVVIYLRQEGRGIGLINKLKALDTAQANLKLGFRTDERRYDDAITILKDLGISRVHLMTNNPLKMDALTEGGIEVVSRQPVVIEPTDENKFYLHTKRSVMGHLF